MALPISATRGYIMAMNKHLFFAAAYIRCGMYQQATKRLKLALGCANIGKNHHAMGRIMVALNLTRNR